MLRIIQWVLWSANIPIYKKSMITAPIYLASEIEQFSTDCRKYLNDCDCYTKGWKSALNQWEIKTMTYRTLEVKFSHALGH